MEALEVQEIKRQIAADPTTSSPYPPQKGICGHCGSADVEPQWQDVSCHACGKWSDLQGNPIEGNPRHRANDAVSMPWINDYLDRMK